MDDVTFLRRLAERGRVALLADGTAVPAPSSVMDDESMADEAFVIDLVSPTEVESGDGRSFKDGTISVRELPIPLLWQFQLDDGHKGAVIVGRIDFIEETERGLGNARGVFDSGPWGQEAKRLVKGKFLRGVSGDYSNFSARVTPAEREAADGDDPLDKNSDGDGSVALKDDKISVTKSRLVAATLVSKPAFEGCLIRMADEPAEDTSSADPVDDIDPDTLDYPDGIIEAALPITAAALIAGGMRDVVERLERLEAIELEIYREQLAITASAVKQRVEEHRLRRERESVLSRVRSPRPLLASAVGTRPRGRNGQDLLDEALVRWPHRESGNGYHKGRIKGFDPRRMLFSVRHSHTGEMHVLPAMNLEPVKAVIPSSQDPDNDGDIDIPGTDTDGDA